MANRYLLMLSITALCVLGATAALNILVDPFGLWELGRLDGVNRYKGSFTRGMQPVKPHVVRRQQPKTLILGSSRVGEGLSCAMLNGDDCYNGAFPGGSLYEASRLMAQNPGTTRSIYLGLDFEAAIKAELRAPGFTERRFIRDAQQQLNLLYPWQAAVDYFSLAVAADTSLSTLRTLAQQDAERVPIISRSLAEDGSWDIRPSSAGDTALARQQARVYRLIRRYSDTILGAQLGAGDAVLAARMDAYFALLGRIINEADSAGIALQLFINPSHALYHDALLQSGAAPLYMEWLENLQRLEQAAGESLPPVWNFAVYDQYSRSDLPGAAPNPFFNDPVHYSRRLGEKLVHRMRGSCIDTGIGHCLRDADLEAYRSEFLANGNRYAEALQESGFLAGSGRAKPAGA